MTLEMRKRGVPLERYFSSTNLIENMLPKRSQAMSLVLYLKHEKTRGEKN